MGERVRALLYVCFASYQPLATRNWDRVKNEWREEQIFLPELTISNTHFDEETKMWRSL